MNLIVFEVILSFVLDSTRFEIVCRPVVPGCAVCAMAHPDFGRSVKPISTSGVQIMPT